MPHRWQVPPGVSFSLAEIDPSSIPHSPDGKQVVEEQLQAAHAELAAYQDRLWAEARRSLLVVLQAMDTGGKDGTIKHVFRGANPQGTRVTSFKAPTPVEAAHDFLWRVHAHVPQAGEIGIFNRSHYEDVLIARVHGTVPEHVWQARFAQIVNFEESLVRSGTTVVKIFLHISKEEQRRRLQRRIDTPTKRWKFAQSDLDERKRWDAYQSAYQDAISATSTDHARWHVIPADRKWYRNWAVSQILIGTLRKMDPTYPEPPEITTLTVT